MTNIAFAGLTAAGKTTHARRLAADLGYSYVSATDILLEILRVPDPGAHLWFTQLDAITAARERRRRVRRAGSAPGGPGPGK